MRALLLACLCALALLPCGGAQGQTSEGLAVLAGEKEASKGQQAVCRGRQAQTKHRPPPPVPDACAQSANPAEPAQGLAFNNSMQLYPMFSFIFFQVPPVDSLSEGFWNATLVGDRCQWTLQVQPCGELCSGTGRGGCSALSALLFLHLLPLPDHSRGGHLDGAHPPGSAL